MKYPIDCHKDNEIFDKWLENILEILKETLILLNDNFFEAEMYFSGRFELTFPRTNKGLNDLRSSDCFTNLDPMTANRIWHVYMRLLDCWMDIQNDTLPFSDTKIFLTKKKFKQILLISIKVLEDIKISSLRKCKPLEV